MVMQRIFALLLVLSTLLFAYNPFFDDKKEEPKKEPAPIIIKDNTAKSEQLTYFGFVESQKGRYALVKLNSRNIVLSEGNSFELGSTSFSVVSINSNSIVLSTKSGNIKTIYFSSQNSGNRYVR